MKRVLLLVSAVVLMAACSESPTAPSAARKAPAARASHDDIFCESGYVIAFDENGNPICVPDPNGDSQAKVSQPTNSNPASGSGTRTPPDGL
jgi:hypothetical protein